MAFLRLIPILACAAVLSACASVQGGAPRPPALSAAVAEADAAIAAGQKDKAYAILKGATATYPTEKAPWQRMAQLRFEAGSYGEAIINAQEALQRDPDDMLAYSIVAVSGLRVTSMALAELTRKNNLNGDVRTEAQELAKLLRTALNGAEILPPKPPARTVTPPRDKAIKTREASIPAPLRTNAASNDPFDILK